MTLLNEEQEAFVTQAKAEIAEITGNLQRLIEIIRKNTVFESQGRENIKNKLNPSELYALAIQIPSECAYIQECINDFNITLAVNATRVNSIITGTLGVLGELKGDAKERLRRAEHMNEDIVLPNEMLKQKIKALQNYIERADKVYEGVKKIIDSKNREWNFDNKMQ